jgi:DNA-directed RNA polymerase specialized sigma54-like protein
MVDDLYIVSLARAELATYIDDVAVHNPVIERRAADHCPDNPADDLNDESAAESPHPAQTPGPRRLPDVVIESEQGQPLSIRVEDADAGVLHLPPIYAQLAEAPGIDQRWRNVLRGHIDEGQALLDALARRRALLSEVVHRCFRAHAPFLLGTSDGFRPTSLSQLASALDIRPPVLRAVIANKQIAAPAGVIPLSLLLTDEDPTTPRGLPGDHLAE